MDIITLAQAIADERNTSIESVSVDYTWAVLADGTMVDETSADVPIETAQAA